MDIGGVHKDEIRGRMVMVYGIRIARRGYGVTINE